MKRKTNKRPLGERLVASMKQVVDALESDQPLAKRLSVREVEVIDPGEYTAARIRKLRDTIGTSQGVFARIVGVSVELIEHWEQGVAKPRPIARRLLDEISRDPQAYATRVLRRKRVSA
ncbi:MAG: hypothetical protein QM770_05260 [Tepidisphaeraceae bacterium]